jgi:phosphate-selective porin OprO/OprP
VKNRRVVFWFLFFSILAAEIFFGGISVRAEVQERAQDSRIEERLDVLEKKLEQLEKRVDALAEPNSATQLESGASQANILGVPEGDRLEQLNQKVKVLERLRENEQENLAAKLKETPVVLAGKDGFVLKSADNDYQLKITGLLQSDGQFFVEDPSKLGTNTFLLRRARPSFQGTLGKYFEFRIVPDFGNGTTVLQDAYIDWKFSSQLILRSGKYKTPFGLEQLQSDTDVPLILRGLPSLLAPNRDIGLQLGGDLSKGRFNYALGIFNGVQDGGSADSDANNEKDFAARIFATPYAAASMGHPLKGLGVGFAVTTGHSGGSLGGLKTSGQNTFFSYASGVTLNGRRYRYSPQAYYYYGSLGLLAEYIFSAQELKKGNTSYDLPRSSWQISASYLLTGEKKSYKGVIPTKAFFPTKGGWGAWELAARYGVLSIDQQYFQLGFADLTKSAREIREWTAGINWYLNKNLRISVNYEDIGLTGGAAGGDRGPERLLLNRFQIAF